MRVMLRIGTQQACQVLRIARVTHAIGSFHTLTCKPGLFSRIIVHAWNQDMASSFTSIRNQNATCIRPLFIDNK